jgi:YceI-like domain
MTEKRWIIVLVAVVVAIGAVIGGSALHAKIENDKAPGELSLSTPSADSSASPATISAGDLAGDWFTLTSPVDIAAITLGVVSVEATGDLTIAGVTQSVTVALDAQSTSAGVEVSGSIPVTFSDYGGTAPDLGFVKVEDSGTVEMLLAVTK